jgi:hypothetical protein
MVKDPNFLKNLEEYMNTEASHFFEAEAGSRVRAASSMDVLIHM